MSPIVTKYPQSGLSTEQERHILDSLANQSQTFIPNVGQVATPANFYTRGAGYGFYFTPETVNMAFIERPAKQAKLDRHHRRFRADDAQPETEQARQGMALSLRFIGSNPSANITARKEEPGTINFFIGNDPAKWRTNLHSYAEIVYPELWPNIDMVFRNTGGVLKYEFIIQPGANLNNIRLTYDGADNLSPDADGNLLIHTPMGILTEQCPVSYQPDGEQQLPVATEFTLECQPNGSLAFGFTVGAGYDPRYPLVIDPGLVYSTYLGGDNNYDEGFGIVIDTSGNAYVTGLTESTDFPTTPGAFQTSLKGFADAFVTKLNPAGSALVYSTYLGGDNNFDEGLGIAVDTSGNAYVTGLTESTDFPTTPGAFQTSLKGFEDGFITKLNPTGSALVYSTYLGGSSFDRSLGIAVDTSGSAYVTGFAQSTDFPTTPGAFQISFKGVLDIFITKLNPTGSALVYSTYLGGSNFDEGFGIAIDTSGNAYVTGFTQSTDFPTTLGAFQTSLKGFEDGFVTKLNSTGSALVYSTYLGGNSTDEGFGIAVDTSENAYITGLTQSTDFPTTPGAFQTSLKGISDVFVTKLDPAGATPVYSTYLGGSSNDEGNGIAVDTSGNAYITGFTSSTDFPTTPDAFQTSLKGAIDTFVSKLNPAGSALLYSTYLGGSNSDASSGIAADTSGNAYVTGLTQSTDFPTTPGAFQTSLQAGHNAFVAKVQTSPNDAMRFLGFKV
ncbi:SBBP repeat-containing protein [Pelosinus baikalensis]|uniref:SBBP repeat-containing protein n=1 Tax=Pelosinus baikalensis TaxID=2892015 RepID=A0ABS8I0J2_9FIRM|nr:SBBP repeat-containing protein [Pelosinus baikalensis]MCC5468329.1 SBBP repeat-containing protein [Pelosinus baikalensis]